MVSDRHTPDPTRQPYFVYISIVLIYSITIYGNIQSHRSIDIEQVYITFAPYFLFANPLLFSMSCLLPITKVDEGEFRVDFTYIYGARDPNIPHIYRQYANLHAGLFRIHITAGELFEPFQSLVSGTVFVLRYDRVTEVVWPYLADIEDRVVYSKKGCEIGLLSHQSLLRDFLRNYNGIGLFGIVRESGRGPVECVLYAHPKSKSIHSLLCKDKGLKQHILYDIHEFPSARTASSPPSEREYWLSVSQLLAKW